MDISVNLHGKEIAAEVGCVSGLFVVKLRETPSALSRVNIFVPNSESAQRIADAINAAFESEAV